MLDLPRQLGPYRVVREIGRGGMGAVYLDRDQRLDRDELVRLCKSIARVCDDDTISLEDAAFGYKGLLVVERCFRSFKRTQIKMTPIFHWLPRRIEVV